MKLLTHPKTMEVFFHSSYPHNHTITLKFEKRKELPVLGQKIRRRVIEGWRMFGILPITKIHPDNARNWTWLCMVDRLERAL